MGPVAYISFEVECSNNIELALVRDSLHDIMVDSIMMRTCHMLNQKTQGRGERLDL